jgi:small subunit ribosomal protein S19e
MAMYDIKTMELVENLAEALKGLIKQPEWTLFVKTSHGKERPPLDDDWWYLRAASVLKNVAFLGPIGVSKLRTKYGTRKNRGHQPDKFVKGSGKIIRDILQQLEKAGLVKQGKKGAHKGRILTPQGQSLIDKCSFTKKITKKEDTKPKKTEKKESTELQNSKNSVSQEQGSRELQPKVEELVNQVSNKPKEVPEIKKEPAEEIKTEQTEIKPQEATKEKPEPKQPKEIVEEKKEEIKIKEEPEKPEEFNNQPKTELSKEQKIQDKTEKQ